MISISASTIIRDRGQITIPDTIRNQFSWLKIGSAISFLTNPESKTILISAHNQLQSDEVEWSYIWDKISLNRSFNGQSAISLSKFIEEDRNSH